jgi:hypothetical protein
MVDTVLEAIARHDSAAIRSLLVLNEVPCTHAQQNVVDPLPECPPGVAEGTPVPVFNWGACHPAYLVEEGSLVGVAIDIASPEQQIFAVTRMEGAGVTAYGVILSDRRSGLGTSLSVSSSGISAAKFSCGFEDMATKLVQYALRGGWTVVWQRDP